MTTGAADWERKLSLVLEHSPTSVVVTDLKGTIEYVNPHFTQVSGYTAEEAIGQNPRILQSGKTSPEVFRDLWSTVTAGRVWQGEFVNRRKDGVEYAEKASIAPILDPDGAITGFVATKEDVTERKLTERRLREAVAELERTTALAEAMAAKAEAANSAKGEFLANMSHEIRTPMNGVIGMTSLLLDTELDDEQRRCAEIVQSSAESLLALLNDILDFSKIEAGRLEMESVAFDLRSLVEDVVASLAFRVAAKGLSYTCETSSLADTGVVGDPGRLRQILNNLLGNAIKFTHQGSIRIQVEPESETESDRTYRFSITDTGVGIPAEKQERLFQKFSQVDASTTREYGGTGLGLAICRQLVALLGGEIGVVSPAPSRPDPAHGPGSMFWFTIRLALAPVREPAALVELEGARVLVLDHNATDREWLVEQLRTRKVRAESAIDGPSGLEAMGRAVAQDDPFRIVVLDLDLPGMDAIGVADAVRADPSLVGTPLVLLTSSSRPGDGRKMSQAGFSGYLPKPARASELFALLGALAGSGRSPTQPMLTRHALRESGAGAARVLVVEDNVTNQLVACGILQKMGIHTNVAANGLEAVQMLMTIPHDLVLMDVQMPEMDGLAATRVIRDPRSAVLNHEIPVVGLSASIMKAELERGLAAGMDDYLPKPVDPRVLAEVVEKWLHRGSSTAVSVNPDPGPGSEQDSLPVFDREGLLDRILGDLDLARELGVVFREEIGEQIRSLEQHLDGGDAPKVERIAHTMKGASGNVCAHALHDFARRMESAAAAGDLSLLRQMAPRLGPMAEALCAEMARI